MPRNFIAELRAQIAQLGPPPACLRFCGCRRLVYRAAQQIGAEIMARRQPDGSFLIWKRPARPATPSPAPNPQSGGLRKTPGDSL